MGFVSPLNLIWLAPVLGGIVALWILRMRRRDHAVSSLFLWRDVTPARKADTPFQRLRNNLLLFLQLIAAFLLVAAVAGPIATARPSARGEYVIVIDNSVTMGASDESPSRLAKAAALADAFMSSHLLAGDDVCIIATSPVPVVISEWGSGEQATRRAIQSVRQTDVVRDLPGTLTLASSTLARRQNPRSQILLFSDGAWQQVDDAAAKIAQGPYAVSIDRVGQSPENVGVTSMEWRSDPESGGRKRVFVQLRNFGDRAIRNGSLVFSIGTSSIKSVAISMSAGGYQSASFDVQPGAASQVVRATISGVPGDFLAADNFASVVIPAAARHSVLLVTSGDLFLERSLSQNETLDLFECTPEQYAKAVAARAFDATVFDGYVPDSLPPGRYLAFHALSDAFPVTEDSAAPQTSPVIVDWSETHPILRFVDLSDVHVASELNVAPARWGTSLVETDSGPAVVVGDRDDRRVEWVSFSLVDSDFPLKVAFPVFIQNSIDWLFDSDAANRAAHPGEALPTFPPGDWTATTPAGNLAGHCANGAGCNLPATPLAGIYRVSTTAGTVAYSLNVASEAGSDIAPRDHASLGNASGTVHPREYSPGRSIAWVFIEIALGLLVLEWFVFHRRRY